jgi:hypothetical protein
VSILTNFVAELGAVVGEELQGSIAVGAVLGDLSLNLAGVGTTDSLGVGRVGGAAEGVDQLRNPPNIPHSFHSFELTR